MYHYVCTTTSLMLWSRFRLPGRVKIIHIVYHSYLECFDKEPERVHQSETIVPGDIFRLGLDSVILVDLGSFWSTPKMLEIFVIKWAILGNAAQPPKHRSVMIGLILWKLWQAKYRLSAFPDRKFLVHLANRGFKSALASAGGFNSFSSNKDQLQAS